MDHLLYTIFINLDILGIILLVAVLIPVVRLMRELPEGGVKNWWKILIPFIIIFIGMYIYIAYSYRFEHTFTQREIITTLIFIGALFVVLVTTLSLRTALDVKRMYNLEIENITDSLMGINNRRYLERILSSEFSKAKTIQTAVSGFHARH